MAQLVARYLGVVEAASSSLVTQTKNPTTVRLSDFSLCTNAFWRFGALQAKHAFKVFRQHDLALSTIVQVDV